jgi:PleD family two-component response regulator
VFAAFIVRHQIKRERMLMTREEGLKQEVTQAIEKATTDNLTKCYNRNKLEVVLAAEILQHKNEEEPFSLIMMDIDFYMVVILVLGMRIFNNLAIIRRLYLKK